MRDSGLLEGEKKVKLVRPIIIAFSMYSRFPMPRMDWTKKSMAWALCCFPAVGIAVGFCLFLWLLIAKSLEFGTILTAAIALLLPILLSGGIHLDGLCDTADALGSHQPRERKLEILKDSHCGAFGVITCVLYLVVFFAAWCEVQPLSYSRMVAVCLVPVLSRSLSGLMAVTQPNARGSGLLATFTEPMDLNKARVVMSLWIALVCVLLGFLGLGYLIAVLLVSVLTVIYYVTMSRRMFGGVTGDLAGFFLQICEVACVLAVAVVPKIVEVLQL